MKNVQVLYSKPHFRFITLKNKKNDPSQDAYQMRNIETIFYRNDA